MNTSFFRYKPLKLSSKVIIIAFMAWFILGGNSYSFSQEVLGPEIQEVEKKKSGKKKKSDNNESPAKEPHSIKKATIYSAVLPGLGQAYNKKYWKIPIIYTGFGVMTYFIVSNVQEFRKFKEAYVYTANGETYPIDNDYVGRYTEDQLQSGMDQYRRYRDLSIIITVLWYGLNILDANVDAHFVDYDISDDLSLNIKPYQQFNSIPGISGNQIPETGLKLTFKF